MARDIFTNKELMSRIDIITDREESLYDEIPGWEGGYLSEARSGKAILLYFPHRPEIWFPMSQLRRAEDNQSIYASNWILEQKGLP